MKKFELSLFSIISGVGSASGLVYHQDKIYLISDHSTYLYQYSLLTAKLDKIALGNNSKENIAKHLKPDFETLTLSGNTLIFMSSGATQNRCLLGTFELQTRQYEVSSIETIFEHLKKELSISDNDLNIEGLIITPQGMLFFQRGNGPSGINAVISIDETNHQLDLPVLTFTPIDLPKIKTITTTFTDAIQVEDKIYFIATAEDVASTYEDGKVLGSIFGVLDVATLALEKYFLISETHKFEGITFYKKKENSIEFLLCEDKDNDVMLSSIYKLSVY